MSVLTPAHLHVNIYTFGSACLPCASSLALAACPGIRCIACCVEAVRGWLRGLVSSLCRAPAWDREPKEQTTGGVLYLEWDALPHAWARAGFI